MTMADTPIPAQGMTVQQLFNGRRFGILYYQREYSWSRGDVKILLSDLHQRFAAAWQPAHGARRAHRYPPYFLGSIVYYEDDGTTYVVDGQQRITTLHLLLIHLYRLLKEQEATGEARHLEALIRPDWGGQVYAIDIAEYGYIYDALMDAGSVRLRPGASPSERNLLARGRDLDDDFPADLCGEALAPFAQWLLDRVCLAGIRAAGRDHGWQIFETTNDRGVRLGPIDLLKSRLLAMAQTGQEKLNGQWREMLARLGDVGPRVPSDFIKAYLLARHVRVDDETDRSQASDAFHEWVRLNAQRLALRSAADYGTLIRDELAPLGGFYATIAYAAAHWDPAWTAVFYNEHNQIPHHLAAILAAVRADDSPGVMQQKAALVAGFLDLLFIRRLVADGISDPGSLEDEVLALIVLLRACGTADSVRAALAHEAAQLGDGFGRMTTFAVTPNNGPQVRYLLARLTAYVEVACGRRDPIQEYLDADRPYEIFSVWGENFERYSPYAGGKRANFEALRHRLGTLLLLSADDCADLASQPYDKQLESLRSRHALAASLDRRSHEQGLFKSWADSKNLTRQLRPFPNGFTREAIDQRQVLYQQLCTIVWSRATLGLVADTPPRKATPAPRRRNSGGRKTGSTIAPLVKAGIIAPDEPLIGTRRQAQYAAIVEADGSICLPTGERFPGPDQAGAFVLNQKSCVGWTFWHVIRGGGRVSLEDLRAEAVSAGLIES
jgi:hypothetical protein